MRATFAVHGMVCDSCSNAIGQALEGVPGVVRAQADHELEAAAIEYDPAQTDVVALATVIDRLGYEATLHSNLPLAQVGSWNRALNIVSSSAEGASIEQRAPPAS